MAKHATTPGGFSVPAFSAADEIEVNLGSLDALTN
jgi:hypothetical protein